MVLKNSVMHKAPLSLKIEKLTLSSISNERLNRAENNYGIQW